MRIDTAAIAAAYENLTVLGNNISNSNTVGFKSSTFQDILGQSIGSATTQNFTQGSINIQTNKPLDVAINGNGFFKVMPMNDLGPGTLPKQSGPALYTRDGQFSINANGYLTDKAGNYVVKMQGDDSVPIKIPETNPAEASSTGSINLNLDSGASVIAPTPIFDPTNSSTYNYRSQSTIYDSKGGASTITSYFVKTSATTWDVYNTNSSAIPTVPPTIPSKDLSLSFAANGQLASAKNSAGTAIALSSDGQGNPLITSTFSAAPGVSYTLVNPTQYSTSFSVQNNANGNSSGTMVNATVGSDGSLIATYNASGSNKPKAVDRLELHLFKNQNGLQQVNATQWVETDASGPSILTAVGTKGAGSLQANATEGSNVNITTAMIDLLSAQRAFQSISQVVNTQSDALQTIVQIGR